MKTTYGLYVVIATMLPLIISILAIIVAIIFFGFTDDLDVGMIIIIGAFIVNSLGAICYILRLKELKKFAESKKRK